MRVLFSVVIFLLPAYVVAQAINLKGTWKFHIGDNPQWAASDFNDNQWGTIYAPSTWEDEGFNGYDGFAWYRKKFDGHKLHREESYDLVLGYIDDCDEVYLNGKLVGFSGTMPPHFKTAYNNERRYSLPNDIINFNGDNTIAIRVFDTTLSGGIVDGDLGIVPVKRNKNLLVDLQGIWMFATSNSEERVTRESDWNKLMVPDLWEHQGWPRYDGYAWYKKTFTLPANFTNEPLILLLGRIDDFDKTYLNGQLIGSTNDHHMFGSSHSYLEDRAYPIPAKLLKRSGVNTIEVFVEDMGHNGGMYEGTIGITTKTNYLRYFKDN